MQGLILAAGMGNRLGRHTEKNTKCMIKVNGKSLIEYSLEALSTVDLKRIIIVVGYEGQKLMDFLGDSYGKIPIVYVNNDIYNRTNNIYSLWLAREYLEEDDTLLLESDLIFEKKIIKDIVENPNKNIAVVAKFEPWMDGTVTLINKDDTIVSFISKKDFQWANAGQYFKTVNIYKFSADFAKNCYNPFLEAYIKTLGRNDYYEQVLRVITHLDNIDFKAHRLEGEKWYEVDDIQDLDIAEVMFAKESSQLKLYQERIGGYWRFPKLKDFCYTINPYFPTRAMNDELQSNFEVLISEQPSGQRIQNLLAAKMFNCDPSEILVGNGTAELIKGLMTIIPGRIGMIYPGFNEYLNCPETDRVKAFNPGRKDFRYSLDDLKEFSEGLDALFVTNPDNPSGNFLSREDILKLTEYLQGRNIKLILDESFVDFVGSSERYTMIQSEYLQRYRNLTVIKNISKSYGVPGIRLGILASGDTEVFQRVRSELSLWNINSFGEYFLQIFGKYRKEYLIACDKISQERERVYNELLKINFLRVIPSSANFFLCEVISGFTATELADFLLKKYSIFIMDCTGKTGLENGEYIRIALRDRCDNDFIIEKLCEVSTTIINGTELK